MKKSQLVNIIREIIEERLNERAKWRSTSVAQKITDPNREDSLSIDYHMDYPRSTGAMRATSDIPSPEGSLSRRRPSDISTQGPRKGMVTRRDAERLKNKIRSNIGPTVVNPETGRTILAKSALSAGPSHPAYNDAKSALEKQLTEYLADIK